MRRRVTRFTSVRPARQFVQWWIVRIAVVQSKAPPGQGMASAAAAIAGAALRARCRSIVADGSSATTGRSMGSYEPAPAPTLRTVAASPIALRMAEAQRGSALRIEA